MTEAGARRATTLDELNAKMDPLVTEAGYVSGLHFVPQSTDVIIASYAKCGTTWLQQMTHSLRTGGDLDFDDISRVVPWIETASDLGIELDAAQRGNPRIFKSHLAQSDVPQGGRYIISVRDPRDALVSSYRFLEGWFFEPGTIGIEELGRVHFIEGRSYYSHLASWWPHRNDPDVLLLTYEHMKSDHEEAVRRVAEFIGVGTDRERLAIACKESSLSSMQLHQEKYDDKLMRERSELVCDLPPGSITGKVGSGEVGAHHLELSATFVDELNETWRETMTAEFGIPSYEAFLELIEVGG